MHRAPGGRRGGGPSVGIPSQIVLAPRLDVDDVDVRDARVKMAQLAQAKIDVTDRRLLATCSECASACVRGATQPVAATPRCASMPLPQRRPHARLDAVVLPWPRIGALVQ